MPEKPPLERRRVAISQLDFMGEEPPLSPTSLRKMIDHLRRNGQSEAIHVVDRQNGRFLIVAGVRRVLAAKYLGWDELEAFITQPTAAGADTILRLQEAPIPINKPRKR